MENEKQNLFSIVIYILLFILIIYSFIVRIQTLMLGIPLWNDEALLAENIVGRTMGEMLTPPLDNLQTAPVLYLIVVKTLTLLFGTSEAVLRVFSLVSFVLMLAAQGLLMRKVFKVNILFIFFSLAVSSTFLYYIQYSTELKPYMGDAAFTLIVFFSYYLYREGLLGQGIRRIVFLGSIFIVCMLFSTPATFAAGAAIFVELVSGCIRRDKKKILFIVLVGIVFLAAFLINYFLWLKPIATDGAMVWYWSERKFSFLITNREVLSHNYTLLKNLLEPVWDYVWFVLPLAISGFVISLVRRNIYTAAVGVFFLVLLIASSIDKYPLQNRLWMFLFVILFIYFFVFIDALRLKLSEGKATKILQKCIPVFLAAVLLLPNVSFPDFGRGAAWTLTPGNQADSLIIYVKENIREGDLLYSYVSANPILKYKNGYDTKIIGNVTSENIIFGSDDFKGDVDKVVKKAAERGAFILYYHSYYPLSMDSNIRKQVNLFQNNGFMDQVMIVDHTYLYWFTGNIEYVRAMAALDGAGLYSENGTLTGIIGIENTGGTILAADKPDGYIDPIEEQNPDKYGRIYIVFTIADEMPPVRDINRDIILGELVSPLLPGESIELSVDKEGLLPGEYKIDLVSYDQYTFSQLGMKPVLITVK